MSGLAQISESDFDFTSDCELRKPRPTVYTPQVFPDDLFDPDRPQVTFSLTPMEEVLYSLPPREGYRCRVKRWLRGIAKAEGFEINEEENEGDQSPKIVKKGWYYISVGDWADASPVITPEPDAEKMVDPKLLANFRFVQKTARIRKLSYEDSRRLHIVFRASAEEKIRRIQNLIRILLPLVEEEMRMTKSCRSRSPSS